MPTARVVDRRAPGERTEGAERTSMRWPKTFGAGKPTQAEQSFVSIATPEGSSCPAALATKLHHDSDGVLARATQ